MAPVGGGELLVDRVVAALRDAILSGDIEAGTRLSVPELARQLDVSRTPAREALFKLQREGLVTVVPRRGAVVLSGEPGDLAELFEYREALEGMAARLATDRMSAAAKRKLRKTFQLHAEAVARDDLSGHLTHDTSFHELFIEGSGNARVIDELQRLRSQLTLLTRKMTRVPGALERVVDAHKAILVGIESGNRRHAENAARVHVRAILAFYSEH